MLSVDFVFLPIFVCMFISKGSFKINRFGFEIGYGLWMFLFSGSNIDIVACSDRERDLWILLNGFILSLVLVFLFPGGILKLIGAVSSSEVDTSDCLDIKGVENEKVEFSGSEGVL